MFQLRIQTESIHVEALETLFFSCGALSVSVEDAADSPIFEPAVGEHPVWPHVYIHAFFDSNEAVDLTSKALSNAAVTQHPIIAQQVAEQDWQAKFQQEFSARKYGQRLWIYPSWTDNPDPGGLSLQLDPGLAFGTGHHPTTELCLNWLSQAKLNDKAVIDFGCGSGILSLAAHKLGADHIYAVDIDPQAHTATRNNISNNQLDPSAFCIGDAGILDKLQADIIIANILMGPLLELRDLFTQCLASKGLLVMSGILCSQAEQVITQYQADYHCLQRSAAQDWSCLCLQRNL